MQRFCQQCGRFHQLKEFDGDKRCVVACMQAVLYAGAITACIALPDCLHFGFLCHCCTKWPVAIVCKVWKTNQGLTCTLPRPPPSLPQQLPGAAAAAQQPAAQGDSHRPGAAAGAVRQPAGFWPESASPAGRRAAMAVAWLAERPCRRLPAAAVGFKRLPVRPGRNRRQRRGKRRAAAAARPQPAAAAAAAAPAGGAAATRLCQHPVWLGSGVWKRLCSGRWLAGGPIHGAGTTHRQAAARGQGLRVGQPIKTRALSGVGYCPLSSVLALLASPGSTLIVCVQAASVTMGRCCRAAAPSQPV